MKEINKDEFVELCKKSIKDSGKYAEVNILIGSESEKKLGGYECKEPIVSVDFNDCESEDIGCMYMALLEIAKQLEESYPSICYAAKKAMKIVRD